MKTRCRPLPRRTVCSPWSWGLCLWERGGQRVWLWPSCTAPSVCWPVSLLWTMSWPRLVIEHKQGRFEVYGCRFLSWSHSTDKPKQEAQPCSKMTHLIQHVYIVGLWGKSWVNPAIKQSFPFDFTSHFCYHLLAFLPSMLISLSLSVLSRGASAFSCLKIRSSRLANKVRSWPHTWARA